MRSTPRSLGLAALLLAAVPAFADPELSKTTDKDKLDQILNEVRTIKQDLDKLQTTAIQVQKSAADVRDLQRRMENLEQSLERLAGSRTRISSSFTPSEPAAGTVRIQNRYAVPATVYLNGRPFTVPPYETRRVVGQPLGAFTYEVQAEGFGVIQPVVSRVLNSNETFSIFINPPPAPLIFLP